MVTDPKEPKDDHAVEACNEVRLIGRVSTEPEERVMPSGDPMLQFRLVVRRDPTQSSRSKQTVDVLECVAWRAAVRRSVSGWRSGDVVEISGSVRRRFYRADGGAASRYEIEVLRGRILRRATT